MAEIRIHREHAGPQAGPEIAWKWAEQVEQKFDMECTVLEGETSDTVEFTRSGVSGELIVAPDHFELVAQLGFLLGAFKKTIEGEIEKELDALLAASGRSAAKRSRPERPAGSVARPRVRPMAYFRDSIRSMYCCIASSATCP
jgi:putative polyhydroxyalkanoate system protein